MPNIPNVPGVPALSSYGISAAVLLTSDVLRTFLGPFFTRWGILLNGFPVIFSDNTVQFDYTEDYAILDYRVERGGFQSYNKVAVPSKIKVTVSCGGNAAKRQAFLASIKAQMSNTLLYDVLTPEGIFIGYNFTHQDFRRKADNGVGLVMVDLHLTEVRVTATATFTNTQQPGIAGGQGLGNIQPQTVDPRIATAVTPDTVK